MKKFGITIALATVLTVGGVYATFNYAQGNAQSVSNDVTVGIENAVIDTVKGTISINSDYTMTIDDKGLIDGGTSTYVTGLVTNGSFKVNFTASTGADTDVRTKGIVLEMAIKLSNNEYNGSTIFDTNNLDSDGKVTLNNEKEILGDYEVDLSNYLSLHEHTLSTYDDYTAYKTALDSFKINITISEKI